MPFFGRAGAQAAYKKITSQVEKINPLTGEPVIDSQGNPVMTEDKNYNAMVSGGNDAANLEKYLRSLTPEETTAYMQRQADFDAKVNAVNQGRQKADTAAGDLGNVLSMFGANKDGTRNEGATYALDLVGNAIGQGINALETGDKAAGAARAAGAMAEAQNEKARASMMSGAQSDVRDMNLQNAATGRGITDTTLQAGNAFDAGMQGIAMSGIEGSENAERNLQYGVDRADENAADQFAIMNDQAADYENSMANSFSQLQQNKSAAMTSAYSGVVNAKNADITANRQLSAEIGKNMPTTQDYAALFVPGSEEVDPLGEEQPAADAGDARANALWAREKAAGNVIAPAATPATPERNLYDINKAARGFTGLSAEEEAEARALGMDEQAYRAWQKRKNAQYKGTAGYVNMLDEKTITG